MPRSPDACSSLRVLTFRGLPDVPHAISTRHGGVSSGPFTSLNMGLTVGDTEENVQANRRMFFESIGVSSEQIVLARLTHGNQVSVFKESHWRDSRKKAEAPSGEAFLNSDAVISDVPGLQFFLTFADCVPLVFWDRKGGTVGAAHAGWRGTAAGIATNVVQSMHHNFLTNAEDLVVGIGPSIGPCCYSVDSRVIDRFQSNGVEPVVQARAGQTYLDLWETNRMQLLGTGVLDHQIENMKICTRCKVSDFYSHRAAERGRTGRFALCLGKS